MSEEIFCDCCDKVLSKKKGEYDHGCLDCHGQPYADKLFWHRKQKKSLEAQLSRATEELKGAEGEWKTYVSITESLERKLNIAVKALIKIDCANDDMKYFNSEINTIIKSTLKEINGEKE